eukprot:1151888-Amphidinium_carterae.1
MSHILCAIRFGLTNLVFSYSSGEANQGAGSKRYARREAHARKRGSLQLNLCRPCKKHERFPVECASMVFASLLVLLVFVASYGVATT